MMIGHLDVVVIKCDGRHPRTARVRASFIDPDQSVRPGRSF